MKELQNGDIVLTEPHEKAIIKAVGRLLSLRKDSGQFIDWDLKISCTENGSKIKPEVMRIDMFPKLKVIR